MSKGSDLLVAALANEGVDRVFGVPGEENLDVIESLRQSKIELVLTRHEQAAAFMAATHGRLTGRAGVCISTLGPGALNFSTGAAYAHLGAMPMILLTGQKAIMSGKQAKFQIVDVVASMKPLTKMARQIVSPRSIATVVRDAFRVAQEERPGPVLLELPEDVAGYEVGDVPVVPRHPVDLPVAHLDAIEPRGKNDSAGEAAADHDRRGRQSPAPGRGVVELRAAHRHSVFQHADGQGRGHRLLRALHGHRRTFGGRLRARGRGSCRSDHLDRPRHDREAAVPNERQRPAGDSRRLHVGQRRGSVLSACGDRGRYRAVAEAAGRSARRQAEARSGFSRAARRDSGAHHRRRRR